MWRSAIKLSLMHRGKYHEIPPSVPSSIRKMLLLDIKCRFHGNYYDKALTQLMRRRTQKNDFPVNIADAS